MTRGYSSWIALFPVPSGVNQFPRTRQLPTGVPSRPVPFFNFHELAARNGARSRPDSGLIRAARVEHARLPADSTPALPPPSAPSLINEIFIARPAKRAMHRPMDARMISLEGGLTTHVVIFFKTGERDDFRKI